MEETLFSSIPVTSDVAADVIDVATEENNSDYIMVTFPSTNEQIVFSLDEIQDDPGAEMFDFAYE